jgi:hypothetical protein
MATPRDHVGHLFLLVVAEYIALIDSYPPRKRIKWLVARF